MGISIFCVIEKSYGCVEVFMYKWIIWMVMILNVGYSSFLLYFLGSIDVVNYSCYFEFFVVGIIFVIGYGILVKGSG